jgi:dephospho-CoA kinase
MPYKNLYLIGLTGNIACGKSSVLAMLRELGAATIDADAVTHQLQRPGEPVYRKIVEAFGAGILTEPGGPIDRKALGAIVFSDPAALRRLEQIVHPAVHDAIEAWIDAQTQDPGPRTQDPKGAELRSREDENQEQRNKEQPDRLQAERVTLSPGHQVTLSSKPPATSHQPPTTSKPSSIVPTHQPLPVAVIDAIKLIEAGWPEVCDAIWVVTCPPEQQLARLVETRGMSEAEARRRIAAQPPQEEKVARADVVIDNGGTRDATRAQVEAAWAAIPR